MARNPLYPDALQPVEMQGNDLIGYKPTLADGWDYNAKAYNDWVAQQQADLVARGLNDPQTGWPTQAGWVDAAKQIGNSMLMGTTAPGIRAFHGSPHSFDKFQMDKIGTGEGVQAYGHGLYFAGDEAVARSYRDALAAPDFTRTGSGAPISSDMQRMLQDGHSAALDAGVRQPSSGDAAFGAEAALAQQERDALKAGDTSAYSRIQDQKAELARIYADKPKVGGHMYEVNLNANPEHMLDWDKPVNQTPLAERLSQIKPEDIGLRPEMTRKGTIEYITPSDSVFARSQSPAAHLGQLVGDDTGKALHERFRAFGDGSQSAAVQALQQAGVPGIRYLDGQSRKAAEGTHNYVMFNPENIEILRKYGLAGLMAGGTAAAASDQ